MLLGSSGGFLVGRKTVFRATQDWTPERLLGTSQIGDPDDPHWDFKEWILRAKLFGRRWNLAINMVAIFSLRKDLGMHALKWMLPTLALLLVAVRPVRAAIEDFESGAGGYSFTGLWHVTGNFGYGGTGHALGYVQHETAGATPNGDYNTGDANWGAATSPPITALANVLIHTPMFLTFEAFNHNEEFAFAPNANSNFYDVLSLTVVPYAGSPQLVASSRFGDAPVFIPYWTSSNTGYNLITVDLTAFDNNPSIQLVFRYDTFDPLYNDFPGARIDNIFLSGGNNQNPSPVPEPASLVLFCLGALGMVGGAWRRQDK